MLTEETVNDFLCRKIGMVEWRSSLKENKVDFLKKFVLAHQEHRYYQNIQWSAIDKPAREIPTAPEVIYHGANSSGGSCIHLNYFVNLILQHLGFDAFIIGIESERWPVLLSHMANIVRIPKRIEGEAKSSFEKDDELYFLDLGFVEPFLEPIPLSKLPFKGRAGGFDMEYRFNVECQRYERWSLMGGPINGKYTEETQNRLDYFFKLTPRILDDFSECMNHIFAKESKSAYLDNLILSHLTFTNGPENFSYVCCRSKVFVQGTKEDYKETSFESYEEMVPVIKKYFPKLNFHELNLAIENYVKAQIEKDAQISEKVAE